MLLHNCARILNAAPLNCREIALQNFVKMQCQQSRFQLRQMLPLLISLKEIIHI